MHLTNVVVFSTKGYRPQFNKMSNGDLDGDKYIIIWNKDVLEYVTKDKIEDPCKPQDYSDYIDRFPLGSDIPIEDMFTFYLQRDILGILATKWKLMCCIIGVRAPTHLFCL